MRSDQHSLDRRRFLTRIAAAGWMLAAPGVFAEQLALTPDQGEGPFYPDKLPLDTDNDLLILNDRVTPAVGEITHLTGRILDATGAPVRNATVEIWQVDSKGVYIHTESPGREKLDGNFQGFGRFLTGSNGEYYFRTIKPVVYGDPSFVRAPHIHYAVNAKGRERFTTQCYVKGHPQNEKDGLLRGITDEAARASIQIDFAPIKESKIGELAARFDIVLDMNPA